MVDSLLDRQDEKAAGVRPAAGGSKKSEGA
jgi:hypothetical protein